jgi:hypothetical protein
MAPLIMVTLPTLCSSSPLVGVSFELGDPPPEISLLSLACGWPLGANGSLLCEWRSNRPRNWARPAGWGRPAQAHPGPVRSPLCSRGSSCSYALCPLHLHYFDDASSRPRWRFSLHEVQSFTLQSPGILLRRTLVLATIGSDFTKLMNTNKDP